MFDLKNIESTGSNIKLGTKPDNDNLSEILKNSELSDVDAEKSKIDAEKSKIEVDKGKEELENIKLDRNLRKKYAGRVWGFLVAYLIIVVVILFLSGFSIYGFKLPDMVLIALVGSTAVAAIGLVRIIAKGLFDQTK